MLIDELQKAVERHDAKTIMLRDFMESYDETLKAAFLDLGFTETRLFDNCLINDLSWKDEQAYLSQLGQKYRYNVRKEILKYRHHFRVETARPNTPQEIADCYQLYRNVHNKALEFNCYALPLSFFEAINDHPTYDIIRLYLKEDPRPLAEQKPVAVTYNQRKGSLYSSIIVGLDYDYVYQYNAYKQVLYQTLQRAKALGCQRLDLSYTAVLEKKKIGARPYPTYAFTQVMDHFNMAVIEAMKGQKV